MVVSNLQFKSPGCQLWLERINSFWQKLSPAMFQVENWPAAKVGIMLVARPRNKIRITRHCFITNIHLKKWKTQQKLTLLVFLYRSVTRIRKFGFLRDRQNNFVVLYISQKFLPGSFRAPDILHDLCVTLTSFRVPDILLWPWPLSLKVKKMSDHLTRSCENLCNLVKFFPNLYLRDL